MKFQIGDQVQIHGLDLGEPWLLVVGVDEEKETILTLHPIERDPYCFRMDMVGGHIKTNINQYDVVDFLGSELKVDPEGLPFSSP